MKLDLLITQYITYRRSLGEKFKTNETYLKSFCKKIGPTTNIQSISDNMVNSFLYSGSPVITSGWFVKHSALLGFYRYALTRNYVTTIPLPPILPKRPKNFVPYIYSQKELKLLFDTALTYQENRSATLPRMVQAVLILTYFLGLRIHETLSIKLDDIDLGNSLIIIQKSKFYKSRLVPFNIQIRKFIEEYLQWRIQQKQSQSLDASLFVARNNRSFNIESMRDIFQRIRKKAVIKRYDGSNYQPRMHDLRHSFAVHRLTSWYQENKNVQKLLPILSTYLGHKNLSHTTVYLTMTDDLLREAGIRFERYAKGEQQ